MFVWLFEKAVAGPHNEDVVYQTIAVYADLDVAQALIKREHPHIGLFSEDRDGHWYARWKSSADRGPDIDFWRLRRVPVL